MATPRMDITSFVGKLLDQDDVDALREGIRVLAQAVMETEVSTQIGAVCGGRKRTRRRRRPDRHASVDRGQLADRGDSRYNYLLTPR